MSFDALDYVEKLIPFFGFCKIKIKVECELGCYASANSATGDFDQGSDDWRIFLE